MITRSVSWELEFDDPDAFEGGELEHDFGGIFDPLYAVAPKVGLTTHKESFEKIHREIEDLVPGVSALVKVGKMSKSEEKKFFVLLDEWRKFHTFVLRSQYVSQADLDRARRMQNDIQAVVDPEAAAARAKYARTDDVPLTAEDIEKFEGKTKTFLERNWLPVLGIVLFLGTGAYLASAALGYMKLAKVAKLVH